MRAAMGDGSPMGATSTASTNGGTGSGAGATSTPYESKDQTPPSPRRKVQHSPVSGRVTTTQPAERRTFGAAGFIATTARAPGGPGRARGRDWE